MSMSDFLRQAADAYDADKAHQDEKITSAVTTSGEALSVANVCKAGMMELNLRVRALEEAIGSMPMPGDPPPPTPDPTPDPPPVDDDGTRTTVTNLQVQAGKVYRNLLIKGGVSVVWKTLNDVTFVNCDFRDAAVLMKVQARDDGSDACSGWTFTNCTFEGATRADWGHSHGAWLQGVNTFLFEDCTFNRNGWLGAKRFNQNHHVYMAKVGAVAFRRCKFIEASAQGLKCLGFKNLVIDDCEFRENLIDIGGDDREPAGDMVVKNSRFIDTGGTDSINLTYGWSLNFEYSRNPLNSVTISDCLWTGGLTSGPGFSGLRAIRAQGGKIGSVLVENANFDQWNGDTIVNQIGDRLQVNP